jgi:hypothetical protein
MLFKNLALILTFFSSDAVTVAGASNDASRNLKKKNQNNGSPSQQEIKDQCIAGIVGPDPADKPDSDLFLQTARMCELK